MERILQAYVIPWQMLLKINHCSCQGLTAMSMQGENCLRLNSADLHHSVEQQRAMGRFHAWLAKAGIWPACLGRLQGAFLVRAAGVVAASNSASTWMWAANSSPGFYANVICISSATCEAPPGKCGAPVDTARGLVWLQAANS